MTTGDANRPRGLGISSRWSVVAWRTRSGHPAAALATALALHGGVAAAVLSASGTWPPPTEAPAPPPALVIAVDLVEQPTPAPAADSGWSSSSPAGNSSARSSASPARFVLRGRTSPVLPSRSRSSRAVDRSAAADRELAARDQPQISGVSGATIAAVAAREPTSAAPTADGTTLAQSEGLTRRVGSGGGEASRAGGAGLGRPAHVLHAVDSENVYPTSPRALGIEGTVEALLEIDQQGAVVAVIITGRAGYGFDEAAREALEQFRFTPALGGDGRPVRSHLAWKYAFVL
ncbi:MAG: energy transducer TonB, partial [Myxococcales bacterium]